MLHRTFVITTPTASTCLDALEGFDPSKANLTHLVILPRNLTIPPIDGETTSAMEPKSTVLWSRGTRIKQRIKNAQITECSANLDAENDNHDESKSPLSKSCSSNGSTTSAAQATIINEDPNTSSYYREWLEEHLDSNTLPISYSYSNTKAYLMLPHDHIWLKQNMDVQYVLVAPNDPMCFGEPFVQFLLWNCFIGGNTILLNWLLTFPAHHHLADVSSMQQQEQLLQQNSKGYVYNPRTQWFWEFGGDQHQSTRTTKKGRKGRMSSKWNKLLAKFGVFIRTSFLFFFCTTLVSFTLRETQERMLDFTRELSRRVRQSISLSDLITTHLVQNLVFVPIMLGMMFFLIEFYHGDKFLAFSISSIVWFIEAFSLLSLRSSQGLLYFQYFFFLLFLLFHVYQTAFPDRGFVYLALTVVWCFMIHSLVFFWHRYELPALVLGHVSIHRPRMILQQHENDEDEDEYNAIISNNNDYGRSDLQRVTTVGPSNTIPLRNEEQHNAWLNEQSSSMTRTAVVSIDDSHLTTPLLTATQTATAAATTSTTTASMMVGSRTSSSTHLSSNGLGTVHLSSRQSFLSTRSTSSRRTSDLYRLNQEDDSSTGSHLYFMGGEVVVHQQRTPVNHTSNTQSNREISSSTIRRGNSIENISASGAQLPAATVGASTEDAPLSSFIRNESNFSLLSSTSDTYGIGSSNNPTNNGNMAIGLDVTGRWSGEPEDDVCDTLPNDTSMETVHISHVSTLQKQQQQLNSSDAGDANTAISDGYYAQESGGLQAIFENKLTPRHRNTNQPHQQPTLPSPSSSSTSPEIHYQRTPPTFPE